MKGRVFSHRTAIRVCAIAAALAVSASPLWPQGLAAAGSGFSSPAVGTQLQMAPGAGGDVFLGKNTRGPYILSWKQIDENSETLTIDGVSAQKGFDYDIDYSSGAIAFHKPLRTGSIARVQYRYTVGKAAANAGSLSLPIEMSLLQRDSSSLRFTGFYRDGAANRSDTGTTVFGLGGDRKWGQSSQFSSLFLTSSADESGANDLGFWDRSAMRFGGSHGSKRLRLSSSYERSGEGFEGNKEYGLKEGVSTMDLGASYLASEKMMLSTDYTRTEDIAGAGKGSTKTVAQQKVAYALSPSSSVAASHKSDETTSADGSQQGVDIERLDAAHSFNANTSATASVATTTVNSAGSKVSSETAANFSVQSSDKLKVQGSYVDSSAEGLGDSSATKFAVTAKPMDTVKVDADYAHGTSDLAGEQSTAGMKVEASPDERVKLQAIYRGSDSSLTGETLSRGAKVELQPTQNVSLAAGISQRLAGDVGDTTKEARVQLRPESWWTLGGGVLYRENGAQVLSVTDVNASIKPVKYVSLAGGYKDRQGTDPTAALDTVALDFSLNTTERLKILGSYKRNPEDATTGQAMAVDSKSFGLETNLGILTFSGGLTRKNDLVLRSRIAETNLGLGIRMSRYGLLTGSYKLADAFLSTQSQMETVTLGYSHKIGSDFNLLLSGALTKYEREQLEMSTTKPDYEAEAKLGMKF